MPLPHLLGIDIGTQGVKAALYTPEGISRAGAFEPSRHLSPAPGVIEDDFGEDPFIFIV